MFIYLSILFYMPHSFVLKVLCITAPYVSFYRPKMVQVVWKVFFFYLLSIKKKPFSFFHVSEIFHSSKSFPFFSLWTTSTFHFSPAFKYCMLLLLLSSETIIPSFLLFQVTWTCGLLTPSVIHFSPLIASLTPFGLLILPNQFLQNHQWPSDR